MSFDTLIRACCDNCLSVHPGTGSTEYEAAKDARWDGWEVNEDSGEALCPSCQKEKEELLNE